jgi:hypothetical protein
MGINRSIYNTISDELFEDNAQKQDYIKFIVSKYFEEITESIDLNSQFIKR